MAIRDTVRIDGDLIADAGPKSWDRDTLDVTISALDGDIGTGTLYVRDQADREYDGGVRILITFDDTGGDEAILLDGYLGEQNRDRPQDAPHLGNRGNRYSIQDGNSILSHRRINSWKRPAETDVARVLAAIAAFAPDVDTADFVPNTNTATMVKKKYSDTFLDEVFQDVLEMTGKTWFVDSQGLRRLHYHKFKEDVGFNAPISIVADGAADGVTTFAPVDPQRRQDPYELTNDVRVTGNKNHVVTVTDSGSIAAHDVAGLKHQDTLSFDSGDTTTLTQYANSILAERKDERPSWACRLENLPDPTVLQAGMLIELTGEVMGKTGGVERISRITWKTTIPGVWHADLEMGNPIRSRRLRKGKNQDADAEDDTTVSLARKCLSANRARIHAYAGQYPTVLADDFDYGGPVPPAHGTITSISPSYRRSYLSANCGFGVGMHTGYLTEEQWVEFDPGDLDGVSSVRFTYVMDPGEFTDGKDLVYGYLPAGEGPPTHEYQFTVLGSCSIDGGHFDIPASLLTPSVTNYVVLGPGWTSMWGAACCDTAMVGGSQGPLGQPGIGIPGGGEFNSGRIGLDSISASTRVVAGSGLTPWGAMVGAIDGDNREFELPDWNGKGVPEVRIGGIEYAAGSDFDLDYTAGTITFNFAPWVGAPVEGRWKT